MIIKDSVVYQDNSYSLTENGAVHYKGKSVVCFLTTANATQVDGVEVPHPFRSGWYTYDGSEFGLTDHGLEAYKKYLIDVVDKKSKGIEEGGVMLGETKINTTKESQSRITGMWGAVQVDPTRVVDFKNDDGSWSQLDADTVISIASTVADHVQACFTNEKVLGDLINGCTTLAELKAVDITTGWPENVPVEETV